MSELISGKEPSVYGVGINDFNGSISVKGEHIREYKLWKAMLRRCYSEKMKKYKPTYEKCFVDDKLLSFSNFHKFVNETHGLFQNDEFGKPFHLDKDLLGDGVVYSEETICFIPHEVNSFLTNKKFSSGNYPIGVLFHKASGKFMSEITMNGKKKYLGLFDDVTSAFAAYKIEKELQAKRLANKYKSLVDDKVYAALISYEVNIDD